MSAGQPVAGDVPSLFDVIINGKGYVFLRTIDTSLPFRTQRASYGRTQTFVPRQNVSPAYGDNQQDYFLTESQNNWVLGEGQLYLRPDQEGSKGAYYSSSGIEISVPGQAAIVRDFITLTNQSKPLVMSNTMTVGTLAFRASGATAHLMTTDSAGTVTDRGDPGAGNQSGNQWGMCTDGVYLYMAGQTKIRKATSAWAFSDFSATANAGALAFHNNALYSCDGSTLKTYDGAGAATTLFTWKDATNTALTALAQHPKLLSWGGKLLIFFPQLDRKPKLYMYDGSATSQVAELPVGSVGYDLIELNGVVFMSAGVFDIHGGLAFSGTLAGSFPVVYSWSGGGVDEVWRGLNIISTLTPSLNMNGMPAFGVWSGDLIFSTASQLRKYAMNTGAVSRIGTFPSNSTPITGRSYEIIACDPTCVMWGDSGTANIYQSLYPSSSWASSGNIITSWLDFDNALKKVFSSVRVDWDTSSDGTVDISYELDDSGTVTSLQTGATSGVDYPFASGITGRKIRLTITLNKGAVSGPILKRAYVQAAPVLKSYRVNEYMLDCSGVQGKSPVILNDNETPHPLSGLVMAQNLNTMMELTTSFTVIDAFGTYVALAQTDLCEVIEVSPQEYIARIHIRQVI